MLHRNAQMADSISALETLTKDMLSQLPELTYQEMSEFVERRQILTEEIEAEIKQCPLDQDGRSKLKVILECDPLITERMQALKEEAAYWLKNRNLAKAQRSAYEAGYTPESILMDRKK